LAIVAIALACLPAHSAEFARPATSTTDPILVATTHDNYPYSYLDDRNQITGFAVEVFDAIARQMNIRFTRVPGTAIQLGDLFVQGEITVHPFFTKSASRVVPAEYSVPYITLQMTLFTRRGDSRFTSFADLTGRPLRIAVGGAGTDYSRANGVPETNIVRLSNNDAFTHLSSGKVDAAIFTRIVGLATIERLHLTNLVPAPLTLPGSKREYRIAIANGHSELLALVNEGLASIQRTGEFEEIYQKWFGRFEPRRFSRDELAAFGAGVLGVALILALWALRQQRRLRIRLARQAAELDESRNILAEAQQFARLGHWQRLFHDGNRLVWSDETFRIHDRDPALGPPTMDELLGMAVGPERTLWDDSARAARENGVPYEFDMTIQPRPGVKKIVHVRGRPVRDAVGQINGLFGTVQDVTPWREAEQALQQSERLLRALYDHLPCGLGVFELQGETLRLVSVNPEATRLLGFVAPPVPGATLATLGSAPETIQFWTELIARCHANGKVQQSDFSPVGTRREIAVTLVPLHTASEGRARLCFLAEDVTTRRQKDAEIAQGRRLRAIGELVGGIAHEFNNLLTPILLRSELIQFERAADPVLCAELKIIIDTARRSAELTRRLLTFGRRTDVRPEIVSLHQVVEGNFNLVRHTIDRRIQLESDLPAILPPLWLNGGDVHQILLNLLLNARDTLVEKLAAQPAVAWGPPVIRLSAAVLPAGATTPVNSTKPSPAEQWVRLTCRDNGLGMSPSTIERVFEPFYTTKQVGHGTGLGLATVWHLVVELGGRVEVESAPGEGSAFHIFLPVHPAPLTAPTMLAPLAATAVREPALTASPGHTLHLLLAEDEESIAVLIRLALEPRGCLVTHASDGRTALVKLSAAPHSFHALIVDLNMPGLAGLELIRRARTLQFAGPIIVTSGRVSDDERRELAKLRVTTIVQKPFSVETLVAALSSSGITLLRPPAPPPTAGR